MTTSARTLELLAELDALGFDDQAFARLHHWRLKAKAETIRSFKAYAAKHDEFQADGNNDRVVKRLELVLRACSQGGFKSGRPEVFCALADAAWLEIPAHPKQL